MAARLRQSFQALQGLRNDFCSTLKLPLVVVHFTRSRCASWQSDSVKIALLPAFVPGTTDFDIYYMLEDWNREGHYNLADQSQLLQPVILG
jgi:hypothetical protein